MSSSATTPGLSIMRSTPAGPSRIPDISPKSDSLARGGGRAVSTGSDEPDRVRGVPRTRKFHHRSKNGCEHCKKRRVRCDERKPVCGNCVKKGTKDLCIFPPVSDDRLDLKQESHSADDSTFTPVTSGPDLFHSNCPDDGGLGRRSGSTSCYSDPPPMHSLGSTFNPSSSTILPNPIPSLFGDTSSSTIPTFDSSIGPHPDLSFGPSSYLPPFDPTAAAPSDIIEIHRPYDPPPLSTPPALSPNTASWLNLLFTSPKTPPLPSLTWSEDPNPETAAAEHPPGGAQVQDWGSWSTGLGFTAASGMGQSLSPWEISRQDFISDAILRQTHILQQPNELATYFPTMEQRRQFSHFLYETSNDLLVVPTPHPVNPWVLHLSHLALGKASGHEILHDAFRLGLLSLASFDIGLKIRKKSQNQGYAEMYRTSMDQRRSALQLLHTAKVLKLYEDDVHGADLVLATVAALAIRDRLAGASDFEAPLLVGITTVMDQGGPVPFIARHPTPVRRFLVEQMATLEILGAMTTWDSPRILSGDMTWFTYGDIVVPNDHLTEVYGWDRLTIAYTADSMSLADEIKQVWELRSTYRKTSYPVIKSALSKRAAELDTRFKVLTRRAAELRLETIIAPLHPRAAVGASLIQACMELLLIEDWPDDASFKTIMYPKCAAILDLCELSIQRGMYAGLLLPLTWAAYCLEPKDRIRLRNAFRTLQPHYHIDPEVMQKIVDLDWTLLFDTDPMEWISVMKENDFYMTIF